MAGGHLRAREATTNVADLDDFDLHVLSITSSAREGVRLRNSDKMMRARLGSDKPKLERIGIPH
jgi:hypothetical protein